MSALARPLVCDSTVLIDYLRGLPAADAYLNAMPEPPCCSEVTRVEVLRGVRSGERSRVAELLGLITWIAVDSEIATRAGALGLRFRASHSGTRVPDLIIAATALELEADLATSNVRHYPMFPGLRPPY